MCRFTVVRVLSSVLTQPEWLAISTSYFQISKELGILSLCRLEDSLYSRCNAENEALLANFSSALLSMAVPRFAFLKA